MKKKTTWLNVFLILSMIIVLVFCSGMALPSTAEAKAKPSITSEAVNKKDIVRVDFIHYVKHGQAGNNKDTGYKLMGVKWNTASPIVYSLNTSSIPAGLDEAAVLNALFASSETWDASTGAELFNGNILNESAAHYGALDGENTAEFGAYSGSNNVIAVTSVWFNRKTKSILEFDMLYNTYYVWGNADTTTSNVMDLQDIATHEFGHAVGLSDIYSNSYSDVTMYGYAGYNETYKRDLAQPDIAGLQVLYGY